jgi:hypothetical protein
MAHSDEDLERILSNGHLSGREYDRIEAEVMRRVAPDPERRRGRWLLAGLAAAGGVGACFFYLGVLAPRSAEVSGFRAKGGAAAPAEGAVALSCPDAGGPCRLGETLVFAVDSSRVSGYLNAYAERVDPPGGERIGYFPTASGSAPRVAPGTGTVVLAQGVRLGSEHAAGLYRVHVWFSDEKPGRSADASSTEKTTSVLLRITE